MERLYGRGRAIGFVKAALKCGDVRDRPLPILLLVGPRGSGGSALLARFWEEFGNDGPCARLDVARAEEVADVMLIAMPGLLRRVWGVRPLHFPLLQLAVKALSFVDDGGGRVAFDAYMRAGGRTAAASSTLRDWTDRVAPLLLSPDQQLVAKAVAQLLGWSLSGIDHHRDRASLRWFATESDVAGGSGLDPLWRLYHWHRGVDDDKLYRVDKTLCAAFLTDMRTDYRSGIRHGSRTRNPGLFLDNADGKAGRRLFELLDECRRKSRNDREHADPLLVVAVQRRLPTLRAGTPIGATDRNLDFAEWRRTVASADYPTLWCPVYLSALSDSDVVEMTATRVLGPSDRIHRDADFIRALTGGHPEATDRLAALLPRLDSPADPRMLLDHDIPLDLRDRWRVDEADATVGDYLLKRAFADDLRASPDGSIDADYNAWLDAMAAGAATPGFPLGACQAVLKFCGWEEVTAVEARDRLTETMWQAEPDDGNPRLHPLAMLLLRHWLARDPAKWADVHQGYVTHYSSPGNTGLRHHHKLALVAPEARWMDSVPEAREATIEPSRMDQLADVVTFLDREWESGIGPERESGRHQSQDWLNVLNTVVAAPNRLRTARRPEGFVKVLAGPQEPGNRRQVIARLAVARWLFNDRLFDPGHQLARVVADEYHLLAQLPGGDADLLLEEEARYRKIQREWED